MSERSSPQSFQDAQSQVPSSSFFTPRPSQVPDSDGEEVGIFFDSKKHKRDFFEQQQGILNHLDIQDREDLAKHLCVAWKLKNGPVPEKKREGKHGAQAKGEDIYNEDEPLSDSDNSDMESEDYDSTESEKASKARRSRAKHALFLKKWTAWPFPPSKMPAPVPESSTYILRDALFTTMLRQASKSLKSRSERYFISTDDTATLELCRPIVQEMLPKIDHILTAMYRARQGCGYRQRRKKEEAKASEQALDNVTKIESGKEPAPQRKGIEVSKASMKKLKLMTSQDVFNYCTLLGWPTDVLHASAKRMAKILPRGGFEDLSYYSIPEAANFSAHPPLKWTEASAKAPPIVIPAREQNISIGGELVDRKTLRMWNRVDSINSWRGEAGGVAPDGFLETIPGKRPRRRPGLKDRIDEKHRLQRKERLQRAWEEQHAGD